MLPPLSNVGAEATGALDTIIHKIMALYSMQPHHAKERQDTFDAMKQLIKDVSTSNEVTQILSPLIRNNKVNCLSNLFHVLHRYTPHRM